MTEQQYKEYLRGCLNQAAAAIKLYKETITAVQTYNTQTAIKWFEMAESYKICALQDYDRVFRKLCAMDQEKTIEYIETTLLNAAHSARNAISNILH